VRTLTSFRYAGRMAAVLAIAGATLAFAASDAGADTSASTAQAVTLSLLGGTLLNSGTNSAANPGPAGDAPIVSGSQPALSLLGTQSTITAGVLAQTAVANGDGTSAACAGLVGNGASIQIGANGNCAVTGGGAGGVTLSLPSLVGITATAILAECTANSAGVETASAQLVDAHVSLAGVPLLTLPVNPAANTSQGIATVLTLGLNDQSTPVAGEIQATALSLNVLNVVNLTIGNVTCGPNAATAATSAFPAKSLPYVGGTLFVMAAIAVPLYVRRRRHLVD
jgi:hypothetical protein